MRKNKKIFKFITDEFIYGGHLLCLGAGAIIITVDLLLNEKIDWVYPFIIYLTAYSSYLYNRYKEIDVDVSTNPERTRHFRKYYRYTSLILEIIFFLIFAILIYSQKFLFLPFYLILFFGGLSYTLYFKRLTKKILSLKNIFTASEWTLPVIFFPIYYSIPFNLSLLLIVIIVYLKAFTLNSYFDIKDIETDRKKKLLTLPVVFTIKKHLKYLKFLIFLFGGIIVLGVLGKLLPISSLFLLITILFNLYIFRQTEKKKISISKLYFLSGAEFISWPLLVLIGNLL